MNSCAGYAPWGAAGLAAKRGRTGGLTVRSVAVRSPQNSEVAPGVRTKWPRNGVAPPAAALGGASRGREPKWPFLRRGVECLFLILLVADRTALLQTDSFW